MFTFGIFTTHFPYIIMVAFYAYFLIFGVSQANQGNVKIAEKSHTVQVHVNNSVETISSDTYCFYTSFNQLTEVTVFERNTIKQKWKHCNVSKIIPQDYCGNRLFSRPPPAFA